MGEGRATCRGATGGGGLTSAFRSERILTMHLFTLIWKVKLMTPLTFSSTSSHRLLRPCDTPQTHRFMSYACGGEGQQGLRATHRVVQALDVEHDGLGPLVAAA